MSEAKPTIANLQLEEDLYFRLAVWYRVGPEESCDRILQRPVHRLQKFERSHYARTLEALRKAGVAVEEIAASPFWTTAPFGWRAYAIRKLCKQGLWPTGQLDDPPPLGVAIDGTDRRILERRIPDLGKMDHADFAAMILALWKSGVPFERNIQASPLWGSAPNQWRNSARYAIRTESAARRRNRIIGE
jgi:hypothetical protein